VRSDRLGEPCAAELDAKLRDVDAGLIRIEAEAGRTAAALREESGRARAEERDALQALRSIVGDLASAQGGAARLRPCTPTPRLAEDMGGRRSKSWPMGFAQSIQQVTEAQRERFEAQARLIAALSQSIEAQNAALRQAVEARLDAIQGESGEKLAEMQRAIDGEVQSARDARLFDSVKRVSESLDQVHKAVGEMQSTPRARRCARCRARSIPRGRRRHA